MTTVGSTGTMRISHLAASSIRAVSRFRSPSAPSPMKSTRRRRVGPRRPIPSSSTMRGRKKADILPRGSSRSYSRQSFVHPSSRCANRSNQRSAPVAVRCDITETPVWFGGIRQVSAPVRGPGALAEKTHGSVLQKSHLNAVWQIIAISREPLLRWRDRSDDVAPGTDQCFIGSDL